MAEFKLDFNDQFLRRGFVDIKKAYTIAAENTLNIMAAVSRRGAIKNVKSDFINRNTLTERSIQFQKASGTGINGLESKAGALQRASYMALQETGGERKPSRGDVLAIPTTRGARGGSKTSLVSKPMYLSKLRPRLVTGSRQRSGNEKQRFYSDLYMAIKQQKLISIKYGIYTVSGQIENGKIKNADMELIYTLERNRVNVDAIPWLEPATEKPIQDAQFIFNGQIFKLLKKDIV